MVLNRLQLTDALKKKFTKCDHIDVDWGVGDGGEGEEEIYQTPVIDSQMSSAVPGPSAGSDGTLKKSETVGSFQEERPKGEDQLVLVIGNMLSVSMNSSLSQCANGLLVTVVNALVGVHIKRFAFFHYL